MPDIMEVTVAKTFGCDGELRVNLWFDRHCLESMGQNC